MFPCMGVFHLAFALRAPKQRCDFLDPYFSLKRYFRHFPTRRAYFFSKLEFRFFSVHCVVKASGFSLNHNLALVHCVVKASGFSLNHNLALESKQNSVEDPPKGAKFICFYKNYTNYTKCVVIWCALKLNGNIKFYTVQTPISCVEISECRMHCRTDVCRCNLIKCL